MYLLMEPRQKAILPLGTGNGSAAAFRAQYELGHACLLLCMPTISVKPRVFLFCARVRVF